MGISLPHNLNGHNGKGYLVPPIDTNVENSQNVRECLRAHWRCGSASSGSVQTSCERAEIWLLILNHHHDGGMGQKKPAEDHKQDHRVLSEDLLKCESREMMLKSHSPVPHPNAPFM